MLFAAKRGPKACSNAEPATVTGGASGSTDAPALRAKDPRPAFAQRGTAVDAPVRGGWNDFLRHTQAMARRCASHLPRPRGPKPAGQPVRRINATPSAPIERAVPVKTFALLPPSGPTVAQQVAFAAARRRAVGGTSRSTQAFDADTAKMLFFRNAPKAEAFADLFAAPVERALESILADETIAHMPARLRQPFETLARAAADTFAAQPETRRTAWLTKTIEVLRTEYPRPWSSKTPITGLLCTGTQDDADKQSALQDYLRGELRDGFAAMASMTIVRSMYMATESLGISLSTLPFATRAARFYVNELLSQTGRIPLIPANVPARHQSAGLTLANLPSPIDAGWMQPGIVACHRYRPDEDNPYVTEALAWGNPYGVGISGSTNIFLFAAAELAQRQGVVVDAVGLTAGMAAMLCYDGGHSLHEAFDAALAFPEGEKLNLGLLSPYHPGYARELFVDLVDPEGRWLREQSLVRLANFVLDQPVTA